MSSLKKVKEMKTPQPKQENRGNSNTTSSQSKGHVSIVKPAVVAKTADPGTGCRPTGIN